MSNKSNHGGKRAGAGAKKKEDKKIGIGTLYLYGKEIELLGGKDEVKKLCYDTVMQKLNEKKS